MFINMFSIWLYPKLNFCIPVNDLFFYFKYIREFLLNFQASNLIYVDQPTGTGFSYSSDRRDIRHDEKGVSEDLYDFLQV